MRLLLFFLTTCPAALAERDAFTNSVFDRAHLTPFADVPESAAQPCEWCRLENQVRKQNPVLVIADTYPL